MRRPQIGCEEDDSKQKCQPQSSSAGALDRMKRFLGVSLRGRQSPTQTLSPSKRTCEGLPSSDSAVLSRLRREAGHVLGRSLEELLRNDEKEQPQGVPSFVHELCCYMLSHGVDYVTLVAEDWCIDRSVLLDSSLAPSCVGSLSTADDGNDAATATGLFRLFLQELPHPLLNKEATASLNRLCKALERYDDGREFGIFEEMAVRFRSVLCRKVQTPNLHMLQYLTSFLHQLRTANHNTCPVTPSALSRLLSRVLTEKGKADPPSYRLAEVLLLSHPSIFGDQDPLTQDPTYSSDSVSSNCDSRCDETTDEGDLFTPDDDDDDTSGSRTCHRGNGDPEDDSTTTTTTDDTDEFRSPPVSPIKDRVKEHPRPGTSRSTDELQDGQAFVSKITPYGKNFLPSITGLLAASSYDCWNLESFPPKEDSSDDFIEQSADSSCCVSAEEVSELDSEADRDADGSETEGPVPPDTEANPCPHEERRSAERFLHSGYLSSSSAGGRKQKRRSRRRHSLDHGSSHVPSSGEEEKSEVSSSSFASLLSGDPSPTPFDPLPEPHPDPQQPFSALLSSAEPVTSDPASWCSAQEESVDDNWQRTAPRYSRNDDVTPMKSPIWFCEDDTDNDPLSGSKYSDPGMSDPLNDNSRPRSGHTAIKMLTKNVNSIKRKVKRFEEEFEKTYGYRPSHSEKMKHKEIKKYMTDLSKAKKDLKQMKEGLPEKKAKSFLKDPTSSISLLRCQESTGGGQGPLLPPATQSPLTVGPGTQETYRQVEGRLSVKRCEAGRPLKVGDLTLDQLKEEKTDIQKALLFYESIHGRPSTREDKELVRPLYDRYRLVKRSVNKVSVRLKENVVELAPILEHVVMDFTLASPQHRGSLEEEDENAAAITNPPTSSSSSPYPSSYASYSPYSTEQPPSVFEFPVVNPEPQQEIPSAQPTTQLNLGDLHALPIHELKERKKEAREQKRRLRHSLRELEEKFERETGRKMQKEDRGPLEKDYNEYKHVKAKLRLLEALLSKHDS